MKNIKVYGHAPYIGDTGYNQHARGFFRALSGVLPVKVRNTTIGRTWKGMSDNPHEGEPYLNEVDRRILREQVLWNSDGSKTDFPMYGASDPFEASVNIILGETGDSLFYDEYKGAKVAYNVWESTLQPEVFFNKLKEYRQLWVPTKWQKQCSIEQGFPEDRIKVVREGLIPSIFKPQPANHPLTNDGRFKFFVAGKWEHRKSTREIVAAFLKEFKKTEPVDLILSADNPFSKDGLETTEKRLHYFDLQDERIKIVHFPPRDEYLSVLKSCHAFVSCARSEGWNIPLMEAMACGVPSLHSNCSGQLEFAEGRGVPVAVKGETPALECVGNYYEPDFEHLGAQMRAVFEDWSNYKERALLESEDIRQQFSWERAAASAKAALEELAIPEGFDLGWLAKTDLRQIVPREIFIDGAYERVFKVEEGDLVVDLGASSGPFARSVLDRKPAHIYCVEPGKSLFRTLNQNLRGYPVTAINKAIGHDNKGFFCASVYGEGEVLVESITFETLVQDYGLEKIDFLKLDCEGGEYAVFTKQNLPLLKGVPKIVGEWHLETPLQKQKFREFRDEILPHFERVEVFSCDGVDIKWSLHHESFTRKYEQVVLHIGNRGT
jgi:FkbM family methyltransferase